MENPWVAEYPKMLPPPRGDPRFGILPPRRAFWRRTAGGDYFLADELNAIPADRVQKDDLEQLFPGHAELFTDVVTTVLRAASSGCMNDWEAVASEQVAALRLLIDCSPAECSWAADAVEYLVQAGCYADDNSTMPCVVEELKKPEYDRTLIGKMLTRTNVDRVRSSSHMTRKAPCMWHPRPRLRRH